MSTLALMSGAESLEQQIRILAESEPHKSFLISWKLKKIAENLEKEYKEYAVNYWQENKELPANFECKEANDPKYYWEDDAEYRQLKAQIDRRKNILKKSLQVKGDYIVDGEIIPKIRYESGVKYSFSQK